MTYIILVSYAPIHNLRYYSAKCLTNQYFCQTFPRQLISSFMGSGLYQNIILINLQRRENTYVIKHNFQIDFLRGLVKNTSAEFFSKTLRLFRYVYVVIAFMLALDLFFRRRPIDQRNARISCKKRKKGAARDRNIRNVFAAGILLSENV